MNLVEGLRKTRNALKERGRTRGQMVDREGKVCLYGAVYCAVYGSPQVHSTDISPDKEMDVMLVVEAISWAIPPVPHLSPMVFNDSTEDDAVVLDVVEQAIRNAGGRP